jgi:endoglucanase
MADVPAPSRFPRWRGFNLTEKFTRARGRPFLEPDFEWIRELGFDYVRLAMSYQCWTRPERWDAADERVLAEVDDAVKWGREYGVHVCVSLHRIPGFCVNDLEPEPFDLFRDSEALDAACWQWRMLATRYAAEPNERVTFNLFNEPISPEPEAHARVAGLVETIREVTPARLIVADGTRWGRDPVRDFVPLGIAQATHPYDPIQVCFWRMPGIPGSDRWPEPAWPVAVAGEGAKWDGLWDRERLRRQCVEPWKELEALGVGVHASELGCFNRTPHAVAVAYLGDLISVLEEAGWGWAMWNFRGPFGIVDSGREDCAYEDFHGHKLDRAMYEAARGDSPAPPRRGSPTSGT